MDQKHAMLYPDPSSMPSDQRTSAAAAIGLPIEAPPSYDVATREPVSPQSNIGWSPPNVTDINATTSLYSGTAVMGQQHQPQLPVIVEQPRYPISPTAPTPHIYNPNQPSVTAAHESAATTVQPTASLSSQLGPNPSKVTCPACGASKISRMCYTPNTRTHLSAFILCLVGWCCCACIVPYCMNSCRTGNHYCAKCNAFLGSYNPRPHRSRH